MGGDSDMCLLVGGPGLQGDDSGDTAGLLKRLVQTSPPLPLHTTESIHIRVTSSESLHIRVTSSPSHRRLGAAPPQPPAMRPTETRMGVVK